MGSIEINPVTCEEATEGVIGTPQIDALLLGPGRAIAEIREAEIL